MTFGSDRWLLILSLCFLSLYLYYLLFCCFWRLFHTSAPFFQLCDPHVILILAAFSKPQGRGSYLGGVSCQIHLSLQLRMYNESFQINYDDATLLEYLKVSIF